ncbi:MAG TPA: hypothetical protein PK867_24105 [Pirellulales bacterium]|nr:hypothetical protein [Pirellulales bacterium]
MPGKFLGLGQRGPVSHQAGDMGVPAGGVEVGNSLRRLVGNADPLQVFFHHQPGAALSQLGKQELIRFHSGQPLPQHGDELGVQRQHVHLAVL